MKKYVAAVIVLLLLPGLVLAQKTNWQNLDLKTDSVFGISTEKAYAELLKNKKAEPVIVAVIDAGIDTSHEDLRAILWNNTKEKLNGKDDDHNAYFDDVHGWDFIGSAKGNVHFDNLELTRQVRQKQARFNGKDSTDFSGQDLKDFKVYQQEKAELNSKLITDNNIIQNIKASKKTLEAIVQKIGKPNPDAEDFAKYDAGGLQEQRLINIVVNNLKKQDFKTFKQKAIDNVLQHYLDEVAFQLNVAYDPRDIIGDDYFDSSQRNYGNNDIMGPDAMHGTHVAGIIGAIRDNQTGIQGVADQVRIMTIRAVPNGDERDKDIANAILYAVNNGAKVINMSFGKAYSQDKKAVDDAVRYALSKDVLIVQAAGNENKDIDTEANFPNRRFENGQLAGAWLVVGASGWKDDETLKAPFSNYGKTAVDVFAPGVKIRSAIPGNKYEELDGTSMACPVVAGLAALIREYYPKLSAAQVKDIIMRSVVKVSHYVNVPYGGASKQMLFSDLCVSGGIVNAFQALQLAATYS